MGTTTSVWVGFELEHDPMPAVNEIRHVRPDVVTPPSRTTNTVATLIPRRRVRRALDVGTGCGALALLVSTIADEVVATDVNARALDFTRRNADLNGVSNLRCVEGSFFEPVSGDEFDLVVGNLPFVVSPPGSGLVFRDGRRDGDEAGGAGRGERGVCERAVASAAEVLAPGGIAQFLVNWVVTSIERPFAEPVRWIAPTGLDAVVLLHSLQSPERYVERWAVGPGDDPAVWRSHLDRLGAVAVANGAVTLRRPDDPECVVAPTIRTVRLTTSMRGNGGRQLLRILDAPRVDDATLLAAPAIALAPHRFVRTDRPDRCRFVADDTCGVAVEIPDPVDEVLAGIEDGLGIDAAVAAWVAGHDPTDRRLRQRLPDATVDALRRLVAAGLAMPMTRMSHGPSG